LDNLVRAEPILSDRIGRRDLHGCDLSKDQRKLQLRRISTMVPPRRG
jgi:hypothetical protein